MNKILILEDDIQKAENYRRILQKKGYEVKLSHNSNKFLEIYPEFKPELIILDVDLHLQNSIMNGIEVYEFLIKKKLLCSEVIVLSGHSTPTQSSRAIKLGAFTFIDTGEFNLEKFYSDVRQAIDKKLLEDLNKNLEAENLTLKEEIRAKYPLIGYSPQMLEVKSLISKFAKANLKVLITGEKGTGKENVAHHLHYLNPNRAAFSFIKINCRAIPDSLADDQLFGHTPEAHSTAKSYKKGYFEQAGKGTLFLDEVADFNLENQARILRTLEESEIQIVGGSIKKVEMNCIFATNKNIPEMIEKEEFRPDLYDRMNKLIIHLPPVRERGEDIILLMEHFLNEFAQKHERIINYDLSKLQDKLKEYHWPKNVRGIRDFCERISVLHDLIDNEVIEEEFRKEKTGEHKHDSLTNLLNLPDYSQAVDVFKVKYLNHQIAKHNSSIPETAKTIGLDKTNIYKILKKNAALKP